MGNKDVNWPLSPAFPSGDWLLASSELSPVPPSPSLEAHIHRKPRAHTSFQLLSTFLTHTLAHTNGLITQSDSQVQRPNDTKHTCTVTQALVHTCSNSTHTPCTQPHAHHIATAGPSPTTLASPCLSLLRPQKGIIRHVRGTMPRPLGTQQKKASLTSKLPCGSLSCSVWDPNNARCLLSEQIKLSTACQCDG